MKDVLLTGGDTELGRIIAEGFRDAGYHVMIAGSRRDDLEVAAKELDVDSIVFDNTDADQPRRGQRRRSPTTSTPSSTCPPIAGRAATRAPTRWHSARRHGARALDATVLSAVLTVQVLGDQLRSGGSIVNVVGDNSTEGSPEAAVKAALSNWTAGQATHFGIRGITLNAVASGRGTEPGYDGIATTSPSVAAEITRLALFLTTPAARHITGQTLHVSHGALASFA